MPHPGIKLTPPHPTHFHRRVSDQQRGQSQSPTAQRRHQINQDRLILPERPEQRVVKAARTPEPADGREVAVKKQPIPVGIVPGIREALPKVRVQNRRRRRAFQPSAVGPRRHRRLAICRGQSIDAVEAVWPEQQCGRLLKGSLHFRHSATNPASSI